MVVIADRGAQGRVGLFIRGRPEGWVVESTQFHRPKVVSYEIVSGANRTPLIRAYLPPSNLYHLPYIKEALNHFLGRYPIVMRYLNADSGCLQIPQNQ